MNVKDNRNYDMRNVMKKIRALHISVALYHFKEL